MKHFTTWLLACLIALLLASAHLLDGPTDIDAAQDVADEVMALEGKQ